MSMAAGRAGPSGLLRGLAPDLRIGFHPSRLARQYQERFGELPSETVARTT